MNQEKKDRLAKFRQKSEIYDCHKDEDAKVFDALLDEKIALNAQARAQADHASSNPSSDPSSSSAAALKNEDDDDDGPNEATSPIDATIKEEQVEDEDENMKDPESTTPSASSPAPDSTTIPTVPIAAPAPIALPIQTTSFQTPSGTPIYFLHGNTLISVTSIPMEIRDATLTLIDMYIDRDRLASDTIFCINQRYDGQSTDDADGMGYACKTCIDKWRDGKNYKGYRVCIRHGQGAVGGQMLDGYFVFAQRRTRNGQIIWRSG